MPPVQSPVGQACDRRPSFFHQGVPEVSVILPTCDRPQLLARSLQSVLEQEGVDLEVIVVDSNHASPPVAENPHVAEMLADPRVVLIRPEPRPYSASTSRNAGLAQVRGEWVSFLDDDDEYLPGRLARPLALARRQQARIVLCGYWFQWPRRRRLRQCEYEECVGDDILMRARLITSMITYRHDPAMRFDETLLTAEDRVFGLTYLNRHGITSIPNVPEPLAVMHLQAVSIHKNKEAAWQSYRVALRLARQGAFSPRARRALMVQGAIERGMAGHGSWGRYLGLLREQVRLRGLRQWRFVIFALLARARTQPVDTSYGSPRPAS